MSDPHALLPDRALITGFGDIGQRLARRLLDAGLQVHALMREPARLSHSSASLHLHRADLDQPQDVGDWPLLFWFAPPTPQGLRDQRLRGWLSAQRGRIERLVYISTPAVYGDCQGRWIDETEPLAPRSERGERRLDAERVLLQWQQQSGTQVLLLRVPGIYGPGRLPVERLRQGLPVLRPEDSPYSNRIHAEDLARAAVHAAVYGRPGRAYHVSDGNPSCMADYFSRCARLLGLPEPPQVDYAEARRVFTPAMWSFMEESKRLKTDRLREELQFLPYYPDLERGLPACLDDAPPLA